MSSKRRRRKRRKRKQKGGSDNQYTFSADEQTGSAQGNLNASLSEQKGRNQDGGGPEGFIPPAGMSGGDAMVLKGVADGTETRWWPMPKVIMIYRQNHVVIMQQQVEEEEEKREELKRKEKRRKSRRKSRRKKKRTRRRRKNLKLLRFSKMPPKYL